MASPNIPIRGKATATAKDLIAAIPANARWRADLETAARELVWLCAQQGYDPAVLWAISRHETGGWTSELWDVRRNPCGLKNKAGDSFMRYRNGVDAIRALAVHVSIYEQGKAAKFGRYRYLDQRIPDVLKVRKNPTKTLVDLRNRWAEDSQWPEKVADHVAVIRPKPAGARPLRRRQAIIPRGNRNRPGTALDARAYIVHCTGNRNVGADAEMHRQFVLNGGGEQGVSFHDVADDFEVVQLLPYTERGIHGGSSFCNNHGEALEICVNEDGNWSQTLTNASRHIAQRLKTRGWTVDQIVQGTDMPRVRRHADCPSYECPREIIIGQGGVTWPKFMTMIREELAAL